jgi:putative peptidoglycan lipid II flippase
VSLVRSFLTVGSNTMASRVLGFVREMMIAAALGAGPVADAFFAAFRFPNLFRRLFAEGAFNAAFIPLFARALEEKGEEGARRFAEEVLAALLVVLLALTALVEIAAPLLVATIIAPGFAADPAKFDLTVVLARIMFPYLALMSLVAMLSGILNALRRYFAAAFAPVLLNVILIAVLAAGLLGELSPVHVGWLMSWGVFAAGVAQLVLLAWAVHRAGVRLKLRRPRLTPGVRRLLVLGFPAAIAGGITQINLFVGQIIAIGVVLLPELSRALKAGHVREAAHTQNRSLEFALFLTLPAAAALFVIPEPVVRVIFERGAFSPETTALTARVLAWFSLGLPAFVLVKVFQPGFFAREDTRTPMYAAGTAMLLNVVLSLSLFPFMAVEGIALATTIAGWVNAGMLFTLLKRRGHWPVEAGSLRRGGLIATASVAMALAVWAGAGLLEEALRPTAGITLQAAVLLALVAGGALLYFALAHTMGAAGLRGLASAMRRNRA